MFRRQRQGTIKTAVAKANSAAGQANSAAYKANVFMDAVAEDYDDFMEILDDPAKRGQFLWETIVATARAAKTEMDSGDKSEVMDSVVSIGKMILAKVMAR